MRLHGDKTIVSSIQRRRSSETDARKTWKLGIGKTTPCHRSRQVGVASFSTPGSCNKKQVKFYSKTNSTEATQRCLANHKTCSIQKNWTSFISGPITVRGKFYSNSFVLNLSCDWPKNIWRPRLSSFHWNIVWDKYSPTPKQRSRALVDKKYSNARMHKGT